jgi:outer membrane protein TolC
MNAPHLFMLLAAVALGGCAGFSQDHGFDPVAEAARAHLAKDVEWPLTAAEQDKVAAQVRDLLAHSLSADDAVQIALLNNRELRASFEELGISEADLVQSGRLPNPRFELRHAGAAGLYDVEETLSFNVLSLLTMPLAHGIEKRRFTQTQDAVVLAVMRLAQETREAYIYAVAAQQSVNYLGEVNAAAETGAELARRMVAAGNWNVLDQSREQIFHSDAVRRLRHAELNEDAAREKLTRLMGLPDRETGAGPSFRLAAALPELPQSIEALPDVDTASLQNRFDLRLMRTQLDELQRRLELTKSTRLIDVLDAGPARVRQGGRSAPTETGYAISFEVPLFDIGAARVRKSEALYAQSVERFAQAAIDARSQIRQAYGGYRVTFELAKQERDEVVPLRKAVAEQNLLRYNASLISIFELLADAREQVVGADAYIQSVRDFWIAKSELDAALLSSPVP